jgi:hypothetical protein
MLPLTKVSANIPEGKENRMTNEARMVKRLYTDLFCNLNRLNLNPPID